MDNMQKPRSKPNKFILRLFHILNDPKHSSTISWTQSGDSFVISNISSFSFSILPLYFRHKNFSSFVRQLNMYNFHKDPSTGTLQVYSHPCFLKGDKEKLLMIHRKTSEQNTNTKPVSELEEKYTMVSAKQKVLNETISTLEQNFKEVAAYNQSLLYQIFQSHEREHKMENLLVMFAKQVKEIPSFLENFYKNKAEFEIVRPIAIPRNLQFGQF
jgi:heat shock transcription factor, other eukaryote